MKTILKSFGIFLLIFGSTYFLLTRPVAIETGRNAYAAIAEPVMSAVFTKANMYSESVKMKDGRKGVFRIKIANEAELQRQIKIARQQGLKTLDVDGKEFFVDYQLFFLTFWLFLTALIFATPIELKIRIMSFAIGTLAFLLYSLLRLYLLMLHFLSNEVDIGIYQYNEFWSGIIGSLASTQKVGFVALVVFLLWLGLVVPHFDWKKRLADFQKLAVAPKS